MDDQVDSMLTTDDNPFNPFTEWDEWLSWDRSAGYYTVEYLGRIVHTSYELSEADQRLAITQAIDEIVELNINGRYKKVFDTNPKNSEKENEN